jgi:preprotein translocase subunit SecE
MADEKKAPEQEEVKTSAKKDDKKSKKPKKSVWAAIKKWFKDMRGENKKIVWPTRKMVLKSTGVVIAAILVVGIGIWILDFAISGAVGAVNKAAQNAQQETTTEAAAEAGDAEIATTDEDAGDTEEPTDEEAAGETEEPTTEEAAEGETTEPTTAA